MTTRPPAVEAGEPTIGDTPAGASRPGGIPGRWSRTLGPANISIVYIYGLGFLLFAAVIPDLWLDPITHQSVLNISFAIPGIVALALVLPLLGGVFDLSIAGTISLSTITVSVLIVREGWSAPTAIMVTLVVCAVAGVVNGLLVVTVGIDSFIATLGTNAVLLAIAEWLSGGIQVTGLPAGFADLASRPLFAGVTVKLLYLLILAVILWYVVEHTPFGRYLQATGDNPEASRLAGVRTSRYIFVSLICSAVIAGVAGVVQTANVGAGSATAGSAFLLPAFAAAFLGATQFKGRFNVWGTLAAIWVLASGVQGVTLAVGSFSWLNNAFFGSALIIAVGLSRTLDRVRLGRLTRGRARRAVLAHITENGPVAAVQPPTRPRDDSEHGTSSRR